MSLILRKYPLFPLTVLLINAYLRHEHVTSVPLGAKKLFEAIERDPAVRSASLCDDGPTAMSVAETGRKNTIVFAIDRIRWDVGNVIMEIRRTCPNIVFVIYGSRPAFKKLCNKNRRFSHYLFIDSKKPLKEQLDKAFLGCDTWHKTRYEYDIALSYAGEDRHHAEQLARLLIQEGARVFYDAWEQAKLLGENLYTTFHDVYSSKCRFCVMFVSHKYVEKIWTSHERVAAQERALKEIGNGFIIPIRIDYTTVPGLSDLIGYANIRQGIDYIAGLILDKLFVTGKPRVQPRSYLP